MFGDDETASESHDRAIRRRQTVRVVVVAVIVAVVVAIGFDNDQTVAVGWVFGDVEVPLVGALVVAFVLGAIVGIVGWRRRSS